MGKKKFITKGESQRFYLLHRSQRDEAYAQEERPSDFVLVSAEVCGLLRAIAIDLIQPEFSSMHHRANYQTLAKDYRSQILLNFRQITLRH